MHYTTEILDRTTGDLKEVSLGDWITVTELGRQYGVGPKTVRAILHHMGLLQPEGQRHGRYRLTRMAVERGFGKRIDKSKRSKWPFDVISPLGQQLVAEAWEDTVADLEREKEADAGIGEARAALAQFKARRLRPKMETQQEVCWLLHHFPLLTHDQIATILDVTRQLVGHYAGVRERQREHLRERQRAELPTLTSLEVTLRRNQL